MATFPNTNEPIKYFVYELKCRRCNLITPYISLSYNPSNAATVWRSFYSQVKDMIAEPRGQYCEACEKNTVQDVVSYENAPAE